MQDKQNEACYLQEHKEDLIEELATTIVQKVWHAFFSLACLIAKTQSFSLVSFNPANSKKGDTSVERRVDDKLQLQLSHYRLNQLHRTEISLIRCLSCWPTASELRGTTSLDLWYLFLEEQAPAPWNFTSVLHFPRGTKFSSVEKYGPWPYSLLSSASATHTKKTLVIKTELW